MHYRSLHHHSTFSFLDGFGLPESHARRAAELGMESIALTEHGNVSSHVQLEQAALKVGVKPIFGCEVYMGDDKANPTQRKNHLTVIAKDDEGYRNLLRLVSRGWDQFYYEPTVYWEDLEELHHGLVVLSGCTGSLLSTSLVGGKNISKEEASYRRARGTARKFKGLLGDRYFLECQAFPQLETVGAINTGWEQLGKELRIPLVATGDVHYTRPTENEMQQILHNVRGGNKQTLEEQARAWGYDVQLCPPTTDRTMYRRLRGTGLSHTAAVQAILSTEAIGQECTVTLPKLDRVRFPLPKGYTDTNDVWRKWLTEGWQYRRIRDRSNVGAYRKRLLYEMDVIEGKDFVDYFLIVSDLVKFAKSRGIPVGPGRGSAAASLVCYLLRITEVDPLAFPNLLFERFIDVTRQDLPDIDLDFDDERRGEIRDYAAEKYGSERVGSIGSFTKYKSKLALDDVARVYRIPKNDVETVKDLLLERSSGDLRASATIEDTVANFPVAAEVFQRHPQLGKAMDLEGQYKGMGVHAAGLVIANGPLTDVCAIYSRQVKGELRSVISADKYDAEHLNILKIDILGLTTMGMIAEALTMLGRPLEWLYEIPLDDKEVIRGFKENDVVGIFQFDGRAMRSVNAEIRPDNFREVCDINALARPGPLHNGATAEYYDTKHGRKEPRRLHPLLDGICASTYYQIVYQEQILRIVREIGNFDWTHAAYIRKIISRKIGEQEFNRQWERFWEGARANGVDEEIARTIWGQCITAGAYAFNVAHSISYGMLAWWTMYLKRYHPEAFYVASLRRYGSNKQHELLRDALRHDIKVLPPHPVRSDGSWRPERGKIRAGLTQVPGIGATVAEKILEYRQGTKVNQWDDLINIKGIGPKKVESFRRFSEAEDPFEITKLDRLLARIRADIRGRRLRGVPYPTHTSLQIPYQRADLDTEVVWMGVIRQRNLKELFELHFSRTGEQLDPSQVKDPHLNEWVVMTGTDETELLTLTCSRWKYPSMKQAIWDIRLDHDVVVIRGVKKGYQSRRAINIWDMFVIDPDDEQEEEVDAG